MAGLWLLAMGPSHSSTPVPHRAGFYWAKVPINMHRSMGFLCLLGVSRLPLFALKVVANFLLVGAMTELDLLALKYIFSSANYHFI
jgi:hypothetical protein